MSDDTTPPPVSLNPSSDIKPPAAGRVAAVVDAWNAKRSEFVINRHIGNHPSFVCRKDTEEVVFGPDADDACWRFLDEQCAAAVLASLPPVRATVSGLRLAAAKDFVGANPTPASAAASESGDVPASARSEITRMAQHLGCDDKPTTVFRQALRLAKRNAYALRQEAWARWWDPSTGHEPLDSGDAQSVAYNAFCEGWDQHRELAPRPTKSDPTAPVTIKVTGIRPLDWRASKHDMHYADPDTAFCGYVIAQTEDRVTWRPSDSDEWRPADDLAHAKSAVQADFLQRLSKFVFLAAAGVSGAPGSWDGLSPLQQAVVSAWNFMQSPTSYSEIEKRFVFELLDAAHKDVYGRGHVTVDVPSSAMIEGIARPIYEEMGYHFDGRTILADGKPYGDWALAIRCAERVVGHIASPPAPAADASDPAIADDIRALGWAVAVHNDYRLRGEAHTFWLFTKDGRAIKGEGLSDADALNQVRAEIASISGESERHG
ncbi:hypothetical protein [Bosea sp. RAC05]|uniref:hypothetical protein n=1 Tax=Bosea sp. RAC05 TaxID=1842539 RepID=UPI00083CB3B9|nr:hypothetical protein [Bosea sp. RAC05]AOG02861.1 hypothetical protein BSY19_5149 [Bosea sp. RAC05]